MARPAKKTKPKPQAGGSPKPRWLPWVQALAIVAAVAWIYMPVLHGNWLMDDDIYVWSNPLLHDPDRVYDAWLVPGSFVEYYPLEEMAQWIEWKFFGNDTFGYHVINVLLHAAGALLVWRLLVKLRLRWAWLGGLVFAIHPVQVESVAWISEFKNTLSLVPFLLALGAWVDFENHRRSRDYALALGFFLTAMLCKISMAPFPVILLLYAWWKRGRVGWTDLKLSLPFFAVSLTVSLLDIFADNLYAQGAHHFPDAIPLGGFLSRLACAGLALSFYLGKCVFPAALMPSYPQWPVDPPSLIQFLPWIVLSGGFILAWRKRQSWGRHVILGLGWFVIFLLPFVGFRTISYMRFTWVMDHFLYIPIIGLIALFVAALESWEKRIPPPFRIGGALPGVIVLIILAMGSHGYAADFVDQETLWTYGVAQNPGAWVGRHNLGAILIEEKRLDEARAQFEAALQVRPESPELHNGLGTVFFRARSLPAAKEEFEHALRIDPGYAEAHFNLGNTLSASGHLPEAIKQYEQALLIDPEDAPAHNNLGYIFYQQGRVAEAIEQFRQTLQLNPDEASARSNLQKLEELPAGERSK